MLKLVLVLVDIVRLLVLLFFVSLVRLWMLLFLVSCASGQLQISFIIEKNDDIVVDNNDLKSAIQVVSGVEPVVNSQMVVTRLDYTRGACQPGYFWNLTFGTCDLCKCVVAQSNVSSLWFEPL
jgi:hypothetical protein